MSEHAQTLTVQLTVMMCQVQVHPEATQQPMPSAVRQAAPVVSLSQYSQSVAYQLSRQPDRKMKWGGAKVRSIPMMFVAGAACCARCRGTRGTAQRSAHSSALMSPSICMGLVVLP